MTMRSWVAVLCAAVVVGAGCSSSPPEIDARALERLLPAEVVPDHPETLRDVTCPEPIVREAGAVTHCVGHVATVPVVVAVMQLDDRGAVRAELDVALFDVAASAEVLARRLTADLGITTTLDCAGPPVRVLEVGEELTCIARDPSGRSRTLAVEVVDDAATLAVTLRPAAPTPTTTTTTTTAGATTTVG